MSNISTVTSTLGLTPSAASQSTNPTSTLTQANFLQLLVTQMTSQDPLSPVSDTDMAAQMAQFSALQTAQATDGDVKVLQANTLLGRTVTVTPTGGAPTSGVISSVQFQAGTPQVMVNGASYALNQISSISPTQSSTQ
ncbi:MAG TPA: flagellar hook capping FlgD N-terminal domain-containing protein [Verrucomicrobiae bacterium]|jgi:flagellar basal-body rod modification protein FlgD|nr:flagellar hook capping FlgD N-terminal domain-containing protein [Verrucomicrobiae bacterium]